LTRKGLFGLFATSVIAGSLAFVIANVSFYLLAGYFDSMSVTEYTSRVAQYFGSYVTVTVMYIGCAAIVQMAYTLLTGKMERDTKAV
jgi:F0F1-type ATP synthase assembly protein I